MNLSFPRYFLLILLVFLTTLPLPAQTKVFQSLDEARKHPRKVYALDLRNQHLTELPADFNRFKNLQTLLLDHNNIRVFPEQIVQCKKLKVLSLSDNMLVQLPESVCLLRQLTSLNLEDNLLQQYPAQLHTLSLLEKLNVRYNMSDSLPFSPDDFPALKELFVDETCFMANKQHLTALLNSRLNFIVAGETEYDNPGYRTLLVSKPADVFDLRSACSKKYQSSRRYFFTDLNEAIRKAPRVRALDLRERGLSALPAEITQLINLEELYLGNRIQGHLQNKWTNPMVIDTLIYKPNTLAKLPDEIFFLLKLKLLDCSSLPLIALDERIAGLQELEELDLSYSAIVLWPAELSQLKKLQFLSAEHLRTDAFDNKTIPEVFYEMRQLTTLRIGYNNWNVDLSRFSSFTSLRELSLSGLQLEEKKVADLRNKLPQAQIGF